MWRSEAPDSTTRRSNSSIWTAVMENPLRARTWSRQRYRPPRAPPEGERVGLLGHQNERDDGARRGRTGGRRALDHAFSGGSGIGVGAPALLVGLVGDPITGRNAPTPVSGENRWT